MIIVVVALLIVISAPLTGGHLGRLSQIRFRATWLVMASLAVQILITVVITDGDETVFAILHLFSYVLAAAFLWLNRGVPGLVVIGAGGMANFAAIGANGGLMPADPRALEIAGLAVQEGFSNSTAVEDARLAVLGDIFAIPAGWPFANVFSIGDVVLLVGVGILVHRVSRWPAQRPGDDRPPVAVTSEPEVPEASEVPEVVEPSGVLQAAGLLQAAEVQAAPRAAEVVEVVEVVQVGEAPLVREAAHRPGTGRVAPVVGAVAPPAAPAVGRCCAARRPHRCCTGVRRGRSAVRTT